VRRISSSLSPRSSVVVYSSRRRSDPCARSYRRSPLASGRSCMPRSRPRPGPPRSPRGRRQRDPVLLKPRNRRIVGPPATSPRREDPGCCRVATYSSPRVDGLGHPRLERRPARHAQQGPRRHRLDQVKHVRGPEPDSDVAASCMVLGDADSPCRAREKFPRVPQCSSRRTDRPILPPTSASSTSAGRRTDTRHQPAPRPGKRRSMNDVVIPAAIEITSCDGVTR